MGKNNQSWEILLTYVKFLAQTHTETLVRSLSFSQAFCQIIWVWALRWVLFKLFLF